MLKRLLIYCFMFTMCIHLFAQEVKTISGVVRDASSGETLMGAIVMEPGTTNGVSTDLDGKFTLNVKGNKVVCSYVGYVEQSLTVDKSAVLNIQLQSNNELDEIVVVGYGVQKKSDLTGSISSVSSKEIKNYAVSNASNLLAGKAAGVYVAASSGQPGANSIVRVRGIGTVNDNNPLYVVDGQFLDNINTLNPADIERMEVLKDASACAIYGSRGSNGVILITTKQGSKGETTVTLDAYIGIKNSYKALKMMNSDQYYDFITTSYGDAIDPLFKHQYENGYNTNWWDEVTQTGFTQNYNLSIRKGSEKSRSSLSAGYLSDEGSIITTKFDRLSLRFTQEYDLSDRITVGANVNLAKMESKDINHLSSFDYIQKADPFTPVINPLVDPNSENYQYNKYAPTGWSFNSNPVELIRARDRNVENFNVLGNAYASVKLLKGLTYRFQFSFERNNTQSKDFQPTVYPTFSADHITNSVGKINTDAKLYNESRVMLNTIVENRLNYYFTSGKHSFDVMGAFTYERNRENYFSAEKWTSISNDESSQVLDSFTKVNDANGKKIHSSMASYLGRINYSFDDRYLATASFRADGSSKFAKGNRWGYFPSFSLGWKLSNEEFFRNLDIENTVSQIKLRLGWGQIGNQRIDRDARFTLVGTGNTDKWWFGDGGFTQGYVPTYTGNVDLKWETSEQINVGADFVLFGNKLDVSADFFVKKTKDMLLQQPMPSLASYSNSPWFNAGDVKNTGFELVVNHRNTIGDFGYTIGANVSTYKTEVEKLNTEYLTGSAGRTEVGGPIGRFYGYKQIGIFQNQAEIDNYKSASGDLLQPNAKPGDFKFAKLKGDGPINDNDDRTYIGDPNPDLIYGFNLGFDYKGFDLTMAFQGTLGNDIWNVSRGSLATAGQQNALEEAYTKAWRKEGDKATYPRMTKTGTNDNFRASSFYVEDGSFLRMQNIQLGYNLPPGLCAKTKLFSTCRVYVSGQNLFTLTKYSGLDPELGVDNPLNMGVDQTRYPSARTITFGVNLQF
ncbi:TonB-dependent receptor [Bacteroides sp. 51]|uniref:SusC/RagA family TonB-linked outer membrane protein n=1 Tax=Bacteroides sp. 51 TaxID=2302938 RepID=UPI0013D77115|nr:TonB-dependent receptor [Bacteroides sp. 51]NDV84555.1 TonB-dependent receptor [Bacteroides sp. 51]